MSDQQPTLSPISALAPAPASPSAAHTASSTENNNEHEQSLHNNTTSPPLAKRFKMDPSADSHMQPHGTGKTGSPSSSLPSINNMLNSPSTEPAAAAASAANSIPSISQMQSLPSLLHHPQHTPSHPHFPKTHLQFADPLGEHVPAPAPLQVKKLTPAARAPTRGSAFAAGYDIYAAQDATIPARGQATVSTGIAIAVPLGTYGRIAPRSGLAAKHGIATGAGVIDYDYRGEVKVLLFNHSDADFAVAPGDRMAQLVLERIVTPDVLEVADLPETARGAGGFGSTGGFGPGAPPAAMPAITADAAAAPAAPAANPPDGAAGSA